MKIEYDKYDVIEDYYHIFVDNNLAGTIRFFREPEFIYKNIKLYDFLGYVKIEKKYRGLGLLKKAINDFNIKSLMVEQIDDIPKEVLIKIYKKLGFDFLEDSETFMIRK